MQTMTTMPFRTHYPDILAQIARIDPGAYGRSRNFLDGHVTRLSPYISRGVISTRQVMESLLAGPHSEGSLTKLLQELAWRDYFQLVWQAKGEGLHDDLRQPQPDVRHRDMPTALLEAQTGITGIDRGIQDLYATGYMHNHLRMYTAALACNVGHAHWRTPARWLYYHLLDADWGSNACSWQWVASAFSGKKYYANQENINRYTGTHDTGTYLDTSYEALAHMPVPAPLQAHAPLDLHTPLPAPQRIHMRAGVPTLLYNFYNLDPRWHADLDANRVLLLEPSLFARYPVSARVLDFTLALADNIPGIQVMVGEFSDWKSQYQPGHIYYKEHPLNRHYQGIEEPRDWMFPDITGAHPSFFAYWKKAERRLHHIFANR